MKKDTGRAGRDVVVGVVISDRMDKTISVRAERKKRHLLYRRLVRVATVYKAHDENNEAQIGDIVEIMSTRPLSKTKCWRLTRVVEAKSKI